MIADPPHRIASASQPKAYADVWHTSRCLVRSLLCSAVAAGFALSAVAQQGRANQVPRSQRHEYRHEIEQLEEVWRAAMLKSNSAAMENLLAEDYTGITAKGAIQTKEQAVANLKSGALQVTALVTSDRKVRVYGSTAVVTSVAELTGGKSDPEVTGRYRYTRVYVRNPQGVWKIVSFEASRIQESAERK
jgi:ketosteroid isomerase-like protein